MTAAFFSSTLVLAILGNLSGLFVAQSQAHADSLPPPQGEIVLRVSGKIGRTNQPDGTVALDQAMLDALPQHRLMTTSTVNDGKRQFDGFLMRDLLDLVDAEGTMLRAMAYNDYVVDLPISDFVRYDVLVASRMDGIELSPRDKGPFWLVYPRDDHEELQDIRFDYRWIWQLREIKVE